MLAATLMRLDQPDEAKAVIAEILKRLPELTLERWPMSIVFRNRRDSDNLFDVLRSAGFP